MSVNAFKRYNAKVLLFGEYLVIDNGDSLAIPIQNFSGFLQESKTISDQDLKAFVRFLHKLDSLSFSNDLFTKKYLFESNIPTGYGVGSSGALTAAIYDAFILSKAETVELIRFQLAEMESFFHGFSSGMDPLVSYYDCAIKTNQYGIELLKEDNGIKSVIDKFCLMDTMIKRSTGPLVKIFKDKKRDKGFKEKAIARLAKANRNSIKACIDGDYSTLQESVFDISNIQFAHFKEMIPTDFQKAWEHGLNSKNYFMKLCGAGGGGFILIFLLNPLNTLDYFEEINKELLNIQY